MTETNTVDDSPDMAEVLSPPSASPAVSSSPHQSQAMSSSPEPMGSHKSSSERPPRPREPRERLERVSSYGRSRMSNYSQRSRPQSTVFPAFHSSLTYALVRDFAYPAFHPMHYGPPPDPPSGATTPNSEWRESRRLSDPMDSWNRNGPWLSDGGTYPDHHGSGEGGDPLPSTSFGDPDEESSGWRSKHRKSKSYADMSEWERERGRRRESSHRSREGDSMFVFGSQLDPAGSESLRQSRSGYGRRDSHFATTLPNRSFHHSSQSGPAATGGSRIPDEDMIPLDSEASQHAHSPQRASMGPEDELFAGESLALYNFEPENPNELRLREGQIILVSYRHGQGWLVAEDPSTGEQGLVPEEYVRLVSEIEGWDPERGTFVEEEEDLDMDESGVVDESGMEGEVGGGGRDEQFVSPPPVDHEQGLKMKDVGVGVEELRQDSAHAER